MVCGAIAIGESGNDPHNQGRSGHEERLIVTAENNSNLSLLFPGIIGIFSYASYRSSLVEYTGEQALILAKAVSSAVDGDKVACYNETGLTDDYYGTLVRILSDAKKATGVKYVYVFADAGDDVKYIADGYLYDEDQFDVTELGDLESKAEYYPDGEPDEVLKTGQGKYSKIDSSELYGDLISGYAPIFDSKGNTVGILGADIDASGVNINMNRYLPMLVGMVILAALLLYVLIRAMIYNLIIRPLRDMTGIINQIAVGNLDVSIQPKYLGKKDEIGLLSKAFQNVIGAVSALLRDVGVLTESAFQGRLSVRADLTAHRGDYRRIAEGINRTLDAVIAPLNVAAACVDRISKGEVPDRIDATYSGDFNVLISNLNTCIDAVNLLVADADMLSRAAISGRLSERVDAYRHSGDFRKIVTGFNATLDAVTDPIREAASILEEMAKGNLNVNMSGQYCGDHAVIKEALNGTILELRRYVGEIHTVLSEIAGGNLDVGITVEFLGDFNEIRLSINHIVASLNGILGEIAEFADEVAAGTGQVSEGSESLSHGAAEQAESIERLTVSAAQITAQTSENAANASRASDLAAATREQAAEGNGHMQEMLKSMADISNSSASIERILKVIDSIAFQTNLLALNASVEAAHAGESGRGFAVVADEVRGLAMRSADAASETATLVEASARSVEAGSAIVERAAKALNAIVSGVQATSELAGSIARTAHEQAMAVGQINVGITAVGKVVQTTAATAEQSAAASRELSGQARHLKEAVAQFHLRKA